MTEIRIVAVNIHGQPVGEHCYLTRYSDSMVDEAKALRAEGWTLTAIGDKLGCHHTTVLRWVNGQYRKPAVKVVARRVKTPNHSRWIMNDPPHSEQRQGLTDAPAPTVPPAVPPSVASAPDPDDFSDLA